MTKSRTQLEEELRVNNIIDREREKSDERYAIKLVERIVFGICVIIFGGIVYALIDYITKTVK